MELEDITHHTIAMNRKVRALGGDYDGWETKIERGGYPPVAFIQSVATLGRD
ncbi:hypothetical protein POZ19_22865 [Ralstonia wenshanensis]